VAPNQHGNIYFSMEGGMRIMSYIEAFPPPHKKIISAVKWAEFVSDRMSYIIRSHWSLF
jgi:hypothetical protein